MDAFALGGEARVGHPPRLRWASAGRVFEQRWCHPAPPQRRVGRAVIRLFLMRNEKRRVSTVGTKMEWKSACRGKRAMGVLLGLERGESLDPETDMRCSYPDSGPTQRAKTAG